MVRLQAPPACDWRSLGTKDGTLSFHQSQTGAASEGRSRRDRPVVAFTLLEVLVALTIFAMAAVVLGATYVNALNAYAAASRHNEYDADLRFIRAAVLTEPDRDKAEQGADLDLGGGKRAHWQADIAPTDSVDLFSVAWTCEINDPARSKPYHVAQTFLLLRPTWSDPVERTTLMDLARQRILEIQGVAP
jgi:general secretion pathway protein I